MNKETRDAIGVITMGFIVLAVIAMITILAMTSMTHPSPPSPLKHQFDAKDYFAADQWCKAHGYTTLQDVVHGVSSADPVTVVGASCLDPTDKEGHHIPAPILTAASAPTSAPVVAESASGAFE